MTVKMLSCVAGSLVLCTGLGAMDVETSVPYQGIMDRNVFGLKPPPPPPDPELSKPPPPKITLTGITSILGHKQALMKTPPPVAKAGEQSKGEQSYILSVGERQGDIEVLDIDEGAATVKVNNGGQVYTLSLEKDGPKPSAGGGPAPLPGGAPPPVGFGAPTPPGGNGFAPPPAPGAGNFTMPVRPTRGSMPGVNPAGASYNPGASGGFGAPAGGFGGFGGAPIPAGGNVAGGFGGTPTTPQPVAQQQQQQPNMTPEQQIVMMEAQRELHRGDASFPPLPPTPLNPNPNGTAPENPTQPTTPTVPTLPRPGGYGPPMPPIPGH